MPDKTASIFVNATTQGITSAVRSLYEKYPYPHYPLLAKPRWQEGWLTSAAFNASLAGAATGRWTCGRDKKILIAGCGEILPAIVCANEPVSSKIDAIDLSNRSLNRARFRCATDLHRLRLRQGDISTWMETNPGVYDHIDCYGVLHHLANPIQSLRGLNTALKPGGTARVMVYNSPARSWIHEWQKLFTSLGLNAGSSSDLDTAVQILKTASAVSNTLSSLLIQMGPNIFANRTRFADTFMHPREVRIGPAHWFDAIKEHGLQVIAMFDRYEECDDLVNPMTSVDTDKIITRISSGLFNNNLELFLQKDGGGATRPAVRMRRRNFMSSAPRRWFNSLETHTTSVLLRQRLWWGHQQYIAGNTAKFPTAMLQRLGNDAVQRLARVGALFSDQLPKKFRELAGRPMANATSGLPKAYAATENKVMSIEGIDAICEKNNISVRHQAIIQARLQRAMFPKAPYIPE